MLGADAGHIHIGLFLREELLQDYHLSDRNHEKDDGLGRRPVHDTGVDTVCV